MKKHDFQKGFPEPQHEKQTNKYKVLISQKQVILVIIAVYS